MKNTTLLVFLIICLILTFESLADCINGINCPTPVAITNADIPDNGWYWAGSSNEGVSGWGVNIEIQQASFTNSGNFLFGAFYTYDQNNKAIWYTFSGEYIANTDVYAWREGTGNTGSFSGDIYLSEGGSCLTCIPRIESQAEISDLGKVTITWQNPMQATITIGNITHEVDRFIWHNGVAVNDVSFITKGWWQVYFQTKLKSRNMFNEPSTHYQTLHGLAKFEAFDTSNFDNHDITFYNPNHKYYISSEDNFLNASSFFIYGENFVTFSSKQLLLDYDPITHKVSLYYYDRIKPYEIDGCNYVIRGHIRPSSSHNSMFYASNDERCDFADLSTDDDRRSAFAFMTHVGNVGDALLNNGLFTFNHGD